MNNLIPPKLIITFVAMLSVFSFCAPRLALAAKTASSVENISDVKLQQAKEYRALGLEYQQAGNLNEALAFYQKSIGVYANYAVAYNDIGVVYEALGSLPLAEDNYLKSIKVDPKYASAYTNLALFYEGQRNLEKAQYYWSKRVEVGDPLDPWTQKAVSRLRDIRMSLSSEPFADEREEDILDLMQGIKRDKIQLNREEETLAQSHFKRAQQCFDRGDMATAIKEALDAQYLDEKNPEIEAFIEKVEHRALTQ